MKGHMAGDRLRIPLPIGEGFFKVKCLYRGYGVPTYGDEDWADAQIPVSKHLDHLQAHCEDIMEMHPGWLYVVFPCSIEELPRKERRKILFRGSN